MSQLEKLIAKVLLCRPTSYKEAEKILVNLGFDLEVRGSHHIFRKKGYKKNVSIKKRSHLLPYQIRDLKEVLIDHGY